MSIPGLRSLDVNRRLPVGSEVFLDHIAHFVSDAAAAARALLQAGFLTTPVSIQQNQDVEGVRRPSGTGNVTAMLERGYIEILFQTADTPLGSELAYALTRYEGVHLAAFAAADAEAHQRRLAAAGFHVRPIAHLRRPVEVENGQTEAAFTVARLEPGEMPEGRIQLLTHHTEDVVWQKRWLTHPNGVTGLVDLVLVVSDVEEVAGRFGRYLGRRPVSTPMGKRILLDRGGIQIVDDIVFRDLVSGVAPTLPFMGLYALIVHDLVKTETLLLRNGLAVERRGATLFTRFPGALGQGAWIFVERLVDLPWRVSDI